MKIVDDCRRGMAMPFRQGWVASALLLALILFLFSCAGRKPPEPLHGPHEDYGARADIVIHDVPYAQGVRGDKKLKLDIYSNPHDGLWPVAVMIHGGSWIEGDKSMDNKIYISQVLTNNGYVVFNVNYRLVPEVWMKKQTEDVMAAVIWVKEHATEYGGDPDRFGVIGGSAGGHLAALVAWASDDPYFEPTGCKGIKLDSDVDVAALYYPVLDLDRTLKEVTSVFAPFVRLVLTGKVGKQYQHALQHLSPSYHVATPLPPTIFLTGDADSLKLYPQSVEYKRNLEELGVDARLFTAHGKDHAFTWQYWEPESVASAQAIVEFFDKYLKN